MLKFDRRSIHVEFDKEGANKLISAFVGGEGEEARVFVERSLLPGRAARRQGFIALPLIVSRRPDREREDMIAFHREDVVLWLDADSIDYVLDRLGRCKDEGFSPAEMCEVLVDGDGISVTLYGEYRQDLALDVFEGS